MSTHAQAGFLPPREPYSRAVRPLILGEMPSHGDGLPLGGVLAVRLISALDVDPAGRDPRDLLVERFELLNALPEPDDWETHRAIARWIRFIHDRLESRDLPRIVVCLGRRAGSAIGARDRPFYEWSPGQLYASVVIPHPSGRNLLWNDAATPLRVRRTLLEALVRSGSPYAQLDAEPDAEPV